jgi:beta-carotene 15,15'-dioxygenase
MQSPVFLYYLPILLMALLGIPHGALDAFLLIHRAATAKKLFIYLCLYLFAAGLCILAWFFAPTETLFLLLIASSLHFGTGDVNKFSNTLRTPLTHRFALGGLWAFALPLLNFTHVEHIFASLSTDTTLLRTYLLAAGFFWLLASAHFLYQSYQSHSRNGRLFWGVAAIGILILPPLWAICLYFCAWHSRLHTQKIFLQFVTYKYRLMLWMAVTTLVTFILGYVAFETLRLTSDEYSALLRVFFIGILALTIPHAILVDVVLPRSQTIRG